MPTKGRNAADKTMSVNHHLTDETLQDYAAGALSAAMETLVACHLTVCSHCRARADQAEQLGGLLLDDAEPVAVTASASDVLARLGAEASTARPEFTIQAGVPRPLARLLPNKLEDLEWRRMAPGIKQFNLSDEPRKNGAFKLLHLAPGVQLSDHTHADRELTFVVRGSYTDEYGCFAAGDIADLDGNHSHKPVVNSDEPCIALIASLAPARYSGVVGRLIQPFVGI